MRRRLKTGLLQRELNKGRTKNPRRALAISLAAALLVGLIVVPAVADESKGAFQAAVKALEWRNIGPFRGGRVTAVAPPPSK